MKAQDESENGDDYKDLEKEAQELKFNINKFDEERVYIPNPDTVFQTACSIANKLRDNNKFKLLQFCDKLTGGKDTLKENEDLQFFSEVI